MKTVRLCGFILLLFVVSMYGSEKEKIELSNVINATGPVISTALTSTTLTATTTPTTTILPTVDSLKPEDLAKQLKKSDHNEPTTSATTPSSPKTRRVHSHRHHKKPQQQNLSERIELPVPVEQNQGIRNRSKGFPLNLPEQRYIQSSTGDMSQKPSPKNNGSSQNLYQQPTYRLQRADRTTSLPPKKQPVNNLNQLARNVNQRVYTARVNKSSNGDVVIDMSSGAVLKKSVPILKKSGQSVVDNDLINSLVDDDQRYTIEEVWDLVSHTSPALHQFAVANQLSLDELLMYAKLRNEVDVHPQAIVDHVNSQKPEDKKTVDWKPVKHYENLKKEDPHMYEAIVLEVCQELFNAADGGNQKQSALADAHITGLEGTVANQQNTIRKQWIAIAIKLVMLIAGVGGSFAWGIYGQAKSSPSSAPTVSPTSPPTFGPTFAPTFVPTLSST